MHVPVELSLDALALCDLSFKTELARFDHLPSPAHILRCELLHAMLDLDGVG